MGKLRTSHLVEMAVWFVFAGLAYYFSLEFDRPLDVYVPGAAAWPQAIAWLVALCALGQLYWYWRHGDEHSGFVMGAVEMTDDVELYRGWIYVLRIGVMLTLPFVYSMLLDTVGFYVLTPAFIAIVVVVLGEHRWLHILIGTIVLYLLILLPFTTFFYIGLPVGTMRPFYDISNWLLNLLQ